MNNVVFTKVSIFRNFKDYKFTNKLDSSKMQEILAKLEKSTDLNKLDLSQTDVSVLNYLENYRLVYKPVSIIFIKKNENLSINLFAGEHISIVSTDVGFNLETVNKALDVAKNLANKIVFAYSDQYGFLTSDLTKMGCGIKIESEINLFAIKNIGKIEQVKHNVKNLGYSLKELGGDNYILSTLCNLGKSETEIVEEFKKMLIKLQDLEIESAKFLNSTNSDELLDKVARSYAILNSSHLMSLNELKSHLSLVRLGINLNYLQIDNNILNSLQKLALNKTDFNNKTEMLNLAKNVKAVLKGEKDE